MKRKFRKKRLANIVKLTISTILILSLVLNSGFCIYASESDKRPKIIIDTESGESIKDLSRFDGMWKEKNVSIPTSATGFKVDGKSAILISALDGKILFENNSNEKLPIASVTKVMTLLLILESLQTGLLTYDQVLVASSHAQAQGGSQIWLVEGEQMTVNDLLKAVAIVSANDACVVFAEAISGSEQQFVAKMNERAKSLNMTNTNFKDCSGLDDSGYSTAKDISTMSRQLLKHSKVKEFTSTWMDVLRNGDSQLVNTNRLIRFYDGATGLKTGTTEKSGHCLSATAERDGMELVAVVLGCTTTDKRFGSARQMLDFGFANFAVHTPEFDESNLKKIKVKGGIVDNINTEINPAASLIIPRGKESELKETWLFPEFVEAPIKKRQVIGKIVIEYKDTVLGEYSIYSAEDVAIITFGRALLKLLKNLVN